MAAVSNEDDGGCVGMGQLVYRSIDGDVAPQCALKHGEPWLSEVLGFVFEHHHESLLQSDKQCIDNLSED